MASQYHPFFMLLLTAFWSFALCEQYCTCPLGFKPANTSTSCSCVCDPYLQEYGVTSCSQEDETIQLTSKVWWIGTANSTNGTDYLIHECPFDYCEQKRPVTMRLNSTEEIDQQCAYNRTGIMCGECREGFSLGFASSECKECPDTYLLLLIPFALAGLALRVCILWLNITTATGSIYGLVIYANVVTASKGTFFPFSAPTFLTVFISWINLDWGIDTCFYDGMNSLDRVLLESAFPSYLFILMLLVIILSNYSKKCAKLLSNRNPIAAISTLMVLSYSKLLRMAIAALLSTTLQYPDGSERIVWFPNPNIPYFPETFLHALRFVFAIVYLIGCILFTTLLLFGQWFPRCYKRRFMKWTKNTKYTGFMDTIHAPFIVHPQTSLLGGSTPFSTVCTECFSSYGSTY